MSEISLKEACEYMNIFNPETGLKVGKMLNISANSNLSWLEIVNKDNPSKLPESFFGVETRASYISTDDKVVRNYFLMLLKDGSKCVFYPNPKEIKITRGGKLEDKLNGGGKSFNMPTNVISLIKIEATYAIISDRLEFHKVSSRIYE